MAYCASLCVGAQPVLEGGLLQITPGSGCLRIINGGGLYLPGDATQINVGELGFGDLQQIDGRVSADAMGQGSSYGSHDNRGKYGPWRRGKRGHGPVFFCMWSER